MPSGTLVTADGPVRTVPTDETFADAPPCDIPDAPAVPAVPTAPATAGLCKPPAAGFAA